MIDQLDLMHNLVKSCSPTIPTTTYELVKKYGKQFVPFLRPPEVFKMQDKECFSNSVMLVMNNPELIYCEGYAVPEYCPILIHHAWVMLPDGSMIDPTWKSAGEAYRGIPFTREYMLRAMRESGLYSILDNYKWREIYTDDPRVYLSEEHYANIHQEEGAGIVRAATDQEYRKSA